MPVKLIVHALIEKDGKYLLIKRSKIKRGLPNMYPEYWDIPEGSVEEDELPREGAVRETMEEVNQKIQLSSILHEDSCYDDTKGIVFTRLVYKAKLLEYREVKLDLEEHTAFRWIRALPDMKDEKIVPYLKDILK
ncbi:NUDIX hydrolase [Streptococcus anginosus]|uniref:NUDIX hydrolase n=1 Tax=Streptococcus anginosus TaxID=1328 RepID=UPI0021F8EA05|nr:NUDIX hydrolase [Streptococcus anginosus]MCW1066796.1 NUDIX hydrolase [Streptococcus anginosus]